MQVHRITTQVSEQSPVSGWLLRVRLFLAIVTVFTVTSVTRVCWSDPPPKVCIVVAGDPDATVRTAAQSIATQIESRTDVRTVSDATTRAALYGESVQDQSLTALAELRRAIVPSNTTTSQLDSLGERLGCALIAQLSARPVGYRVRLYDVVHQRFQSERDVSTIANDMAESWIVPAAIASVNLQGTQPTPQVTTTDAGVSTAQATQLPVLPPPQRTQPQNPHPATPNTNRGPTYWPWIVAGGAALLLIGGFILLQNQGPEYTVISVRHPAMAPP